MPDKPANEDIAEGLGLAPKFDADGLVTCVATDAWTGEVLMVAHMNAEADRKSTRLNSSHIQKSRMPSSA